MDRHLAILPLLASSFLLSSNAWSAVSAPLDISATVGSACTVNTTPIDFGLYEGPETTTTGTIGVSCNAGVAYQVGLDAGLHFNAANRHMSNGAGGTLLYYLSYVGTEWGDEGVTNTYPAAAVAGAGAGTSSTYTVDALIWADQAVAPGTYTDTIVVTVAF